MRLAPYNGRRYSTITRSSRGYRPGYVAIGDIVAADFNSTKYPGICKPSNYATLEKFKELQRQANRYAAAKGLPDRVTVDGDIGPAVIALVAKATAHSPLPCTELALQAESRTADMKAFADAKGVPAKVAGPAALKLSTIVDQSGKEEVVPPDFIMQMFGRQLSTTEKVALVGVGGGIAYMLLTKKRRRK
jgi:hypothetical protein